MGGLEQGAERLVGQRLRVLGVDAALTGQGRERRGLDQAARLVGGRATTGGQIAPKGDGGAEGQLLQPDLGGPERLVGVAFEADGAGEGEAPARLGDQPLAQAGGAELGLQTLGEGVGLLGKLAAEGKEGLDLLAVAVVEAEGVGEVFHGGGSGGAVKRGHPVGKELQPVRVGGAEITGEEAAQLVEEEGIGERQEGRGGRPVGVGAQQDGRVVALGGVGGGVGALGHVVEGHPDARKARLHAQQAASLAGDGGDGARRRLGVPPGGAQKRGEDKVAKAVGLAAIEQEGERPLERGEAAGDQVEERGAPGRTAESAQLQGRLIEFGLGQHGVTRSGRWRRRRGRRGLQGGRRSRWSGGSRQGRPG